MAADIKSLKRHTMSREDFRSRGGDGRTVSKAGARMVCPGKTEQRLQASRVCCGQRTVYFRSGPEGVCLRGQPVGPSQSKSPSTLVGSSTEVESQATRNTAQRRKAKLRKTWKCVDLIIAYDAKRLFLRSVRARGTNEAAPTTALLDTDATVSTVRDSAVRSRYTWTCALVHCVHCERFCSEESLHLDLCTSTLCPL
ncbi:hypothetical protein ACOMHN_035613 [Nucella lapillus]